MKIILYVLIVLAAFCLGVFVVDNSFSEKARYLAWDYDYVRELKAQKRCLYYWTPGERIGSHTGKKLLCLPKEYPL